LKFNRNSIPAIFFAVLYPFIHGKAIMNAGAWSREKAASFAQATKESKLCDVG
jgi:hypothetical protein